MHHSCLYLRGITEDAFEKVSGPSEIVDDWPTAAFFGGACSPRAGQFLAKHLASLLIV